MSVKGFEYKIQNMSRIELEENASSGRFVIYKDDQEAGEMTFSKAEPNKIIIDHTAVYPELRERGMGKELVMAGVELARERGLKIIPLCPYAKKVFEQDESIQDVKY